MGKSTCNSGLYRLPAASIETARRSLHQSAEENLSVPEEFFNAAVLWMANEALEDVAARPELDTQPCGFRDAPKPARLLVLEFLASRLPFLGPPSYPEGQKECKTSVFDTADGP